MKPSRRRSFLPESALLVILSAGVAVAADWPMRGRDASRNAVSPEPHAPVDWQIGTFRQEPRNILWSAQLGMVSWGAPVIANGLVWVGTNNSRPRDPANKQDASVLMCFREHDGKFLYQFVSSRHERGNPFDFVGSALASSPLVEDNRLWFCTNRGVVICLDIGPLYRGDGEPRILWQLDMMKELGVRPRGMHIGSHAIHCSIASYGNRLYVNTTNARSPYANFPSEVAVSDAPSLVCFQKDTGRIIWQDNSPGENILEVQHGSPLVVETDDIGQVIMGQGDGWLRSFDALTGHLLWKFDINFKTGDRKVMVGNAVNYFIANPVFYENRIYISSGRHVEHGYGSGRLVCIDPSKRGDISSELDGGSGGGKPNPNSGLIWEYLGQEKARMHRSHSSVVIHNDLVVAPDQRGLIHCLDARTGQQYWTHDAKEGIYGSPLIADGKIYVGNLDGDLLILKLDREHVRLAQHNFNEPIYSAPVYANGVLYVLTSDYLHAIKEEKP